MPNRIHALRSAAMPRRHREKLEAILRTTHQAPARTALDRFWQPEAYDHWVRDAAEHERIAQYIHQNPVKAASASTVRLAVEQRRLSDVAGFQPAFLQINAPSEPSASGLLFGAD